MALHQKMFLRQVPSARAHEQRSRLLVELVLLAFGAGEADLAPHRIAQVHLAIDHVAPGGRGRILKIGHEDIGAGIERVDHHLAIDRAGNLDAAVLEIGRNGRDAPLTLANGGRFRQKIVEFPCAQRFCPGHARGQQSLPLGLEVARQCAQKLERFRGKNLRFRCSL